MSTEVVDLIGYDEILGWIDKMGRTATRAEFLSLLRRQTSLVF